jgi:hypothetical protein
MRYCLAKNKITPIEKSANPNLWRLFVLRIGRRVRKGFFSTEEITRSYAGYNVTES